jgi:hypothetical protein
MDMNQLTTKVKDLALAASLVSCGFEVLDTTRDTSGRVHFAFAQTDEFERTVSAYWADTLDVKARTYSDNIKMLKSRIYSER